MSASFFTDWQSVDRARWDALHAQACAAHQQDWAYGEAMESAGSRVLRACLKRPNGEAIGLAQVIVRPVAMIGSLALCTHGPAWIGASDASERAAAMRSLKASLPLRWPRLLAISPDSGEAPKGFRRVMTGDATVRIDLTVAPDALRAGLNGKWRNRLVAAERSDIAFTTNGAKPGQYQWLLDAENAQRKSRGYKSLPTALMAQWQEAKASARSGDKRGGVVVYRADAGAGRDREPVAAMLFLLHGSMATYHIGWTSDQGRRNHAHTLILWNAMLDLKARGIRALDLGGVNTASGAGIARFKLGAGGTVLQRAGAFV